MNAWGRWSLRVLGLVMMPVPLLAVAAGQVWIGAHANTAVKYVVGFLALVTTGLLLFVAFVLAIADIGFVAGWILASAAGIALTIGSAAAAGSGDLWLLHQRGVETTCTVLEVHEGQGAAYFGRATDTSRYAEYELQCAAPDAPDSMTTDMPVPGEQVAVAYDPEGFVGAHPVAAVADEAPRVARVVGIAIAVWTTLSVGVVMSRMPLNRHRRKSPEH